VNDTSAPVRLQQWEDWLEKIRRQISELFSDRFLYRQVTGMFEGNPELPTETVVRDWIDGMYVTSASIGVRRQLDQDPRVASLAHLLIDLTRHASTVRRSWYTAESPPGLVDGANRAFDDFAPNGQDSLAPEVVEADRKSLETAFAPLQPWVQSRVAHANARSTKAATWKDLDAAIDAVGKTYQKYHQLIARGPILFVEPEILENWQRVFRVPWLPQRRRTEMRATGIVRQVDQLGRIVLPIELRRALNVKDGDALEIDVDGEDLILYKGQPKCVFCGQRGAALEFHARRVCTECAKSIGAMVPTD